MFGAKQGDFPQQHTIPTYQFNGDMFVVVQVFAYKNNRNQLYLQLHHNLQAKERLLSSIS